MKDFDGLCSRLSGDMKGIAHKLDIGLGYADEKDLFQEELSYLWESFSKGDLDEKTDSYILQGCYFHLKNYLRPRDKRTKYESLEKAGPVLSFESVEGYCLEKEISLTSTDILESLSGREHEVASLTSLGLTSREVGSRLNISHVMVVKIMKKVRNKFKK